MKSKKLFAILTLVAFMMTLVPAFAFAGEEDVVASYSASGSSVEVVDDAIEVYNDEDGEYAQITLTFNQRGIGVYGTVYFYAKADNDDLVGFVTDDEDAETVVEEIDADSISRGNGQLFEVAIPAANDGEVYFFVNSYEVGDLEIAFYDGPADLENYPDSRLIGEGEIAIEASDDALLTLEAELDDFVSENIDGAKVNLSSDAGLKASVDNVNAEDESGFYEIAKIEFGDEITLTATVKDKANTKLKDEIVVFKKSVNGGSFTTIAEVATDKNGIAELEVEEERTGQYRYQAVLKSDKTVKSSAMDDYYFTWTANGVAKIVAKTEDGTKVALKEDYKLQFYLYDGNGNLIKGDGSKADLIVEDSPKGSKVKDIKDQEVDSNGIVSFVVNLDKEGTYEFTVEPAGGGRGELDFTVECQEFDEAVEMEVELSDDRPSVVCVKEGISTGTSIVATLIDEDGVEKKISDGTGLKFGSSNRAAVTVGSNGDIVVEDEDFVGTVTITVIDTDSGVNADYELNVVGVPVSFEPVVTVNGKKAAVELQYLDKNGARTYGGNDKLTLILPSGVSSEAVEDFDEDTGIASFDLVATKAGEYTIIANSDIGITKSFKVAFEVPASEKVVKGAENVTMFIGNSAYVQDGVAKVTDVAPFIKDNRTFVAIRPVADAFGCEIAWDEATQTVTLTRDDLAVTIVIGTSDIAVVQDGVTTTVSADVPAFIQNGRTVLPFRAIGNAFGATVNYDAATQSVSYAQ